MKASNFLLETDVKMIGKLLPAVKNLGSLARFSGDWEAKEHGLEHFFGEGPNLVWYQQTGGSCSWLGRSQSLWLCGEAWRRVFERLGVRLRDGEIFRLMVVVN